MKGSAKMKQIQRQVAQQRLGLSQVMRRSLSLLQMGQDEIRQAIERENRRNPFLQCPVPSGTASMRGSGDDVLNAPEIAVEQSNADALISQISLVRMSLDERELAYELAHCLDERGFFTESPEEICNYLDSTPQKVVAVVEMLQSELEPTGVFAWSLQDSFRIQLRARNRYDPLISELLNHLNLIAARDLDKICSVVGVDREDAEDMLDDIRNLSPSPLVPKQSLQEHHQVADIVFRPSKDSEVDVELTEAALPAVLTNDAMFSTIKTAETNQAALAYYRDCYRTAGAFVLAMQKRANTLLLIGNEIARVQSQFIRTGRMLDRRPLTMGGMSKNLGLNKSTICRAVNNCVFETPHGLVPASEFFARSISDGATAKTREQALARLSLLIKTENNRHPLSDEVLAELMSRTNFAISRRTVAKYRGLLDIPNAFARRSAKNKTKKQ